MVSRNPSANTRPPSDRDRSYKTEVQVKHLDTEVRHRRPYTPLRSSCKLLATGSARTHGSDQCVMCVTDTSSLFHGLSPSPSVHPSSSWRAARPLRWWLKRFIVISLCPLSPPSPPSSLLTLETSQHVGTGGGGGGGRRLDGSVSITHQTLPSESK